MESRPSDVALTAHKLDCVAAILASLASFSVHLVYGVTGSGKTEVYLRVIAAAIADGGQALVLVPEIALTPQLVDRFRRRFSSGVVAMHSGLKGVERRDAWRAAHSGHARIIIGTRSAVFTSLPRLALIVVDEEHDASYKQQEGFRYSARDLAVVRARSAPGCPSCSAPRRRRSKPWKTPPPGATRSTVLPQRPGAAAGAAHQAGGSAPAAADQGLSTPGDACHRAAPACRRASHRFLESPRLCAELFCNACGWVAPCAHCDARMTLHRRAKQLRCHHCGAHGAVPAICGSCGEPLHPGGSGHRAGRGDLGRLFPRGAAGAAGPRHGIRAAARYRAFLSECTAARRGS